MLGKTTAALGLSAAHSPRPFDLDTQGNAVFDPRPRTPRGDGSIGNPYRRSILDWTDGEAWISAPSADDLKPHAWYALLHTDRETMLAMVTGQQLLDLREDQETAYRAASPATHTNVWRLNVMPLL
ncbi:hypothetical protein [Nocardia tengchongensis]|uniref:hypothetical protein n=1 Tax=Nocardia tengchongensis TaxID=2055889 RepID=UPI0036655A73